MRRPRLLEAIALAVVFTTAPCAHAMNKKLFENNKMVQMTKRGINRVFLRKPNAGSAGKSVDNELYGDSKAVLATDLYADKEASTGAIMRNPNIRPDPLYEEIPTQPAYTKLRGTKVNPGDSSDDVHDGVQVPPGKPILTTQSSDLSTDSWTGQPFADDSGGYSTVEAGSMKKPPPLPSPDAQKKTDSASGEQHKQVPVSHSLVPPPPPLPPKQSRRLTSPPLPLKQSPSPTSPPLPPKQSMRPPPPRPLRQQKRWSFSPSAALSNAMVAPSKPPRTFAYKKNPPASVEPTDGVAKLPTGQQTPKSLNQQPPPPPPLPPRQRKDNSEKALTYRSKLGESEHYKVPVAKPFSVAVDSTKPGSQSPSGRQRSSSKHRSPEKGGESSSSRERTSSSAGEVPAVLSGSLPSSPESSGAETSTPPTTKEEFKNNLERLFGQKTSQQQAAAAAAQAASRK